MTENDSSTSAKYVIFAIKRLSRFSDYLNNKILMEIAIGYIYFLHRGSITSVTLKN